MRMRTFARPGALLALALLFVAWPARPAFIELTDGSVIRGEISGAADGSCVIRRGNNTPLVVKCGEISRIEATTLPANAAPLAPLRLAGSNTIGARLIPALLTDYLQARGATQTRDAQPSQEAEFSVITPRPQVPGLWPWVEIRAHGTATGFQGIASLALKPPATTASTGPERPAVAPVAPVAPPADENVLEVSSSVSSLWQDIGSGNRSEDSAPLAVRPVEIKKRASEPTKLQGFAKGRPPADIAMASRRITPAEVSMLQEFGALDSPANEHVIALDGLAILVSKSNRVDALSIEQIMGIYTGKITDWSQVGGTPGPIYPVARNEGSGTADTFSGLVLNGTSMSLNVKRIEDSRTLSDFIAATPNSIGFVGMSYVGNAKAVSIRECGLMYPPTTFNAKSEEYPLARRLYLYTPTQRPAEVQDFLAYTNSKAAQAVVARNGFVDLTIEPDTSGEQRRLRSLFLDAKAPRTGDYATYAGLLKAGARLSVTLRFRTNSSEIDKFDLDSRAIHDLDRIREYLLSSGGRKRRIVLAGFSDSLGSPELNRALSLSRAQAVAARLKGLPIAGVIGLGPQFPVACEGSAEGRARNRRVEIWLED
ncbi:MAG: phosphate ABC transporter substrate-binding/OmpA family protein [Betaproteobacteria bacterium]